MAVVRTLALILIAGFTADCGAGPRDDATATRATLDSILAEHGRRAVLEDLEGILSDYTRNAIVRSNHREPIRGQAELRAFFTGVFQAVETRSLTYNTEELTVRGDSAWQIFTYRMTVQPQGESEVTDHGSGAALWLRDGEGTWRIHHDVVNSASPVSQ